MKEIANLLKPKTEVALDLGTNYVKVIKLKKTSKGIQIVKASMVQVKGAETKELRDVKRTEAIKEALVEARIRPGSVSVVGIWCSPIIRYLKLPVVSKTKLRSLLSYEVDRQIPFDVKDTIWDFQPIGEIREGKEKKQEVLLVAVKREVINRYLKVILNAGIHPKVIDANPLAMVNSPITDNLEEEKVTALIDLGARTITINILKGKMLQFTRSFPTAGNALSMALIEKLGMDFSEAEELKCEKADALLEQAEETKEKDEHSSREVSEIIKPVLEELVMEIGKSFRSYKSDFEVEKIDEVILTGGSTKLKNIDKFLAQELEGKVKIGNPLANVEISTKLPNAFYLKNNSPMLSTALGLALRKKIKVNLLSSEFLRERRAKQWRRAFALATSTLIISLLLGNITLFSQIVMIKHRIGSINKEQQAFPLKMERLKVIKKEDERIKEKIALINFKMFGQIQWSPVLYRMAKIIPQEVWLTELVSLREEEFRMRGGSPSHSQLTKFMSNLESSPFFSQMNLVSSQERKAKEEAWIEFEIVCKLTKEGTE